jgi:diguanylate cyclase (GGDEF)-like protein
MNDGISLSFARLRSIIGQGLSAEALEDLAGLETLVMEVFSNLDGQARAVADANALAVDISDKMTVLAEDLEAQNRELRRQNEAIEKARAEFELQSRATAEAAVDAVIEVEASRDRVSQLEQKRIELEAVRLELERKAGELEAEATALADANANAVLLVLEKESSLQELAGNAERAEKERDALQERVFLDELTGLFNYRYFREQIKFEFARARRYGRGLSLVFLDLDLFKQVNDTYGHGVGDSVLREVATLIQAQLRTSDIPVRFGSEPVAVRYGGEELVVILPETDLDGAALMAERIRAAAESHSYAAPGVDMTLKVTLSAGVACMGPEDADVSDLVRRADEALYRAKAGGRNRVEAAA